MPWLTMKEEKNKQFRKKTVTISQRKDVYLPTVGHTEDNLSDYAVLMSSEEIWDRSRNPHWSEWLQ